MGRQGHIRLGVNIDHVATLRQVRGNTTTYPDMIKIMNLAIRGGADQITIHLREDRRHIQEFDVLNITRDSTVDVNLEMGANEVMTKIALKYLPAWVCLVPEKRAELTTEGGLDLFRSEHRVRRVISLVQPKGIEVSLFIEPSLRQVEQAHALGADACEFHTGKWVLLQDKRAKQKEWRRLCDAARLCHELGMRVHAGHGLDVPHVKKVRQLPYLVELNIGHSIICDAVEKGIENSVKQMKSLL
ncbi:MAG: pyridoxine 5'-phosphate synthase [Bdellovibrionaceae bacterium]|nr:pyridoxine 5'-phosphate synthase [Pseudobdellovibrionaceae bacterium]